MYVCMYVCESLKGARSDWQPVARSDAEKSGSFVAYIGLQKDSHRGSYLKCCQLLLDVPSD